MSFEGVTKDIKDTRHGERRNGGLKWVENNMGYEKNPGAPEVALY